MRALQIELGVWKTGDERRRAMAALAEYDECVAIMPFAHQSKPDRLAHQPACRARGRCGPL
jgi:hypothetical protein